MRGITSLLQNVFVTFAVVLAGSLGYWKATSEGQEAYNNGYDNGYKAGYRWGKKDGYQTGEEAGYQKGIETGYQTGEETGYQKGIEDSNGERNNENITYLLASIVGAGLFILLIYAYYVKPVSRQNYDLKMQLTGAKQLEFQALAELELKKNALETHISYTSTVAKTNVNQIKTIAEITAQKNYFSRQLSAITKQYDLEHKELQQLKSQKANVNQPKDIAEITAKMEQLQNDLLESSNRISIITKEKNSTVQQLKSQKTAIKKENKILKNEIKNQAKANVERMDRLREEQSELVSQKDFLIFELREAVENNKVECNLCCEHIDGDRCLMFLNPCGHTACNECARKLPNQKCHVCRKKITPRKLFLI